MVVVLFVKFIHSPILQTNKAPIIPTTLARPRTPIGFPAMAVFEEGEAEAPMDEVLTLPDLVVPDEIWTLDA